MTPNYIIQIVLAEFGPSLFIKNKTKEKKRKQAKITYKHNSGKWQTDPWKQNTSLFREEGGGGGTTVSSRIPYFA